MPGAEPPGADRCSSSADAPTFAARRRRQSAVRVLIGPHRDVFQVGEPHIAVLVIPHPLPTKDPGRIAPALKFRLAPRTHHLAHRPTAPYRDLQPCRAVELPIR
jgi:hypothetical protein